MMKPVVPLEQFRVADGYPSDQADVCEVRGPDCRMGPLTLYEFPARPGIGRRICVACVSSLCDHCGESPPTLIVGAGPGTFHLCASCRTSPAYARKRRVRPLGSRTGRVGDEEEGLS